MFITNSLQNSCKIRRTSDKQRSEKAAWNHLPTLAAREPAPVYFKAICQAHEIEHSTACHNCFSLSCFHFCSIMTGAPNDRFRGNICLEPSRMAKIFESTRTAKNFENVSWWLFVGLRVSGFVWFVHLRISDFVVISRSPRNFVAFVN